MLLETILSIHVVSNLPRIVARKKSLDPKSMIFEAILQSNLKQSTNALTMLRPILQVDSKDMASTIPVMVNPLIFINTSLSIQLNT